MTVEELFEVFRADLQDAVQPYLWSDEELVRYLNSAVQEANERALLTEDRTTPAVCSITLQAGVSTYPLHASVLQLKRVVFNGRPLEETSVEELDADSDNWEARTGTPRCFIFESGVATPRVRLVPTPSASGALALTVYRGALRPLDAGRPSEKPELPARFHEDLRHWVYRCAYSKPDPDTQDKTRSMEHEALFIRAFGEQPDANVQRKQRDRRQPLVRSSW